MKLSQPVLDKPGHDIVIAIPDMDDEERIGHALQESDSSRRILSVK